MSDVDPAGPARLAQLRTNHVILEINRRRITSVADYRAVVAGLQPGEAVALLIYDRRTSQRFICYHPAGQLTHEIPNPRHR